MANSLSDALKDLNDAVTDFSKEQLTEVGQFAVTLISLRTKKGLDADGNEFKPYSKAYLKIRAKRGLRQKPPDLTVTGHMLGSITPQITGQNEVTLAFNNPLEAAKASGNSATRDFFDVRSDQDLEAVAEIVGDSIINTFLK